MIPEGLGGSGKSIQKSATIAGKRGNDSRNWEPSGSVTKVAENVAKGVENTKERRKGVWEGRLRPYSKRQDLRVGKQGRT